MDKICIIPMLFWAFNMVSAQIMLPAYQGVFSTKTLSTVEASNGLNFDGVNDRVISTNDVKFQISVGTIEGWIKTGNAGSYYRGAFGKHRAYCLYLYNNTLAIYDWGVAANRSTGITLNDNTWQGGIANVRAYNKALTDSEIMNLYISTKGVFGF